MKTYLIRAMASDTVTDPAPERRLVWLVLALAVALWSGLGLRCDLGVVVQDPLSMMRFVLGLAFGATSLWAARQLARPGAIARSWSLALVGLLAFGLWLWAYGQAPAGTRRAEIIGQTIRECLTIIPLMLFLPTVVVLAALRQGAVVGPVRAGAVSGLAGGGFAAALYAPHCTALKTIRCSMSRGMVPPFWASRRYLR